MRRQKRKKQKKKKTNHVATLRDHELDKARLIIDRTLRSTGGHIGEASKLLGISRVTLWRRMMNIGIDKEDYVE